MMECIVKGSSFFSRIYLGNFRSGWFEYKCLNINEPSGSDLIDQCQSGPCPINSDCTSHFTGVHCDCHQGYAASGPQPLESCDDLDECVLEYGASISPCVDLAT